jgi:hypothetical protein
MLRLRTNLSASLFCFLSLWAAPATAANFTVFNYTGLSFGNLAMRAGIVTLNPTTGVISGAGYISSSTALRGTIVINRTSAVAVSVISTVPPATITCGGVNVTVTAMPTDDSACTTIATGFCTIYVGINLLVPSTLPPGSCTATTLDVTVG